MAGAYLPYDRNINQVGSSRNSIKPQCVQISNEVKFALDQVPHLIWMTKFGEGYCNTALKQYFGIDHNDIDAYQWMEFLHPEDRALMQNIWMKAHKTGQRFEQECRIRRHDGVYQWFLLNAQSALYQKKYFD